jgi:magnesium-transporting ATPase (P-type)
MNLVHPKKYLFPRILENLMITTVIITIALPEGLPMAVALTLAFSLKKLMDKNNLVRKMHSCETMGGANYILTDKTGTLTTNELSVVEILNLEKNEINIINISAEDNKDENKIYIEQENTIKEKPEKYFKNKTYWDLLRNAISLNVDGHINNENIYETGESKNKTDNALIKFLYRVNSPLSEVYDKLKKDTVKQIPFDSNKKRMTTYIKNNEKYFLFTKGGSENIKNFCSHYIDSKTGLKEKLNNDIIQKFDKQIENCNNNMLRTIYICYKEITKEDFDNINTDSNNENIDTNNLILLAVFLHPRYNKKRSQGSSFKMSRSFNKCNYGHRR